MDVKIVVPDMLFGTSEIKIAKWYKKPGDYIKFDELLLELETENHEWVETKNHEGVVNGFIKGILLEINAPTEGVLKFPNKVGKIVKIGQVIAKIRESHERLA